MAKIEAVLTETLAGEEALLVPCRDLVGRGGKRWRPLLAYLVCEAGGGGEAALPLTPLVELCHTASLIHDDIEDSSPLRRGQPAAHIRYGLDTALNAGAFLYFLPLRCLERWERPAEQKLAVYEAWGRALRRLHRGQALDIAWHRDVCALPALPEYEAMCRLKTGVLARFAVELGLLASGKSPHSPWLNLPTAAEALGVGFQILDDVKNLSGGVAGKERGDDIVEGKKSLPLLLFLHGPAGERERRAALARDCFERAAKGGPGDPAVDRLIAAFEEAGVLDEAASRGKALIAEAADAFAGLAAEAPAGDAEAAEAAGLLAQLPGMLGG